MVKETCKAKMIKGGRVTIPELTRDALNLKEGDVVKITIEKAWRCNAW